jgi:hypothetical protein
MTVPDRIEAAQLLCSLDPPAWLLRHSRAVAEVAAFLAARTAQRGVQVDGRLAEAAALLHDADKALAPDDRLRGLGHGHGSARWLALGGFSELGPAVEHHPVTRLRDGDWFEPWLRKSRAEDRIVAYADKRAQQRLVTLDARFERWRHRQPDRWDDDVVAEVRRRANRLESVVCEAAGIRPDEVRRLPWTGGALRAASA